MILTEKNLIDVVNGKSNRKYVYSQFEEGQKGIYMIVSEEWKYIYSAGDRREFLFDRINDPKETKNKAGTLLLKDVQDKLKNALLEYLKQENAKDAYIETEQGLDWKEYPKLDMNYLDNLDAELIIQDHDAILFDHDGYIPGGYVFCDGRND